MNGVFGRRGSYIFFSLFLMTVFAFGGVVITISAFEEIRESGFVFHQIIYLLGALMMFVAGYFALLFHSYNKGAFLTLENGRLKARFALGKSIDLAYDETMIIRPAINMVHIHTRAGRTYDIPLLKNAYNIALYFNTTYPGAYYYLKESTDELKQKEGYHTKKKNVGFVAMAALLVSAFLLISLVARIIDEDYVSNFNTWQTAVFLIFMLLETAMFVATLLIANYSGRQKNTANDFKHMRNVARAYSRRNFVSKLYTDIDSVLFMNDYLSRIIIYRRDDGACSYMPEYFNLKTGLWVQADNNPEAFPDRDTLMRSLAVNFPPILFINDGHTSE